MGFVFHDTEKPVSLEDLRYPLFKLRELFAEPTPKDAFVFKIRDDTYAATYSLSALPRPVDVGRTNVRNKVTLTMYPQTGDSPGWYISDVANQSAEVLPFDMGHVYDNCLHLQRLMGACPCPNLANGTCTKENILPAFNGLLDELKLSSDYGTITTKAIAHPDYQTLGMFRYISPTYTTEQDFYQALRPWDGIDFTCVEGRVKEIEERSSKRVSKNLHVKSHCQKCVFVTSHKNKAGTNTFIACTRNPVDSCTGIVKTEEADQYLREWYNVHGFGSITDFSASEINTLIVLAGSTLLNRGVISAARKIEILLSGFIKYNGTWRYRVSANKGDTRRCTDYTSFKELITAVPEVAGLLTGSIEEVPFLRKLGCSILGTHTYVRAGWGGRNDLFLTTPGDPDVSPRTRTFAEHDNTEEALCAGTKYSAGKYSYSQYRLYKHTYPNQWVRYVVSEASAAHAIREMKLVTLR